MKSLLNLCELNIPFWELFNRLFIYLLKKTKFFAVECTQIFLFKVLTLLNESNFFYLGSL